MQTADSAATDLSINLKMKLLWHAVANAEYTKRFYIAVDIEILCVISLKRPKYDVLVVGNLIPCVLNYAITE